MASVTLTDVVKEFESGARVVNRVSLDIADHEFVVLVGPSDVPRKARDIPMETGELGRKLVQHPATAC